MSFIVGGDVRSLKFLAFLRLSETPHAVSYSSNDLLMDYFQQERVCRRTHIVLEHFVH